MDRLISPVNLEGLSESGRLRLREETYQQHKNSGLVATLLLLAGGTIAAHRFYLGFRKIAWAIIAVNVFVLVIAIMMKSILLFQIWIVILLLIELFFLAPALKLSNTRLEQQLDAEIDLSDVAGTTN